MLAIFICTALCSTKPYYQYLDFDYRFEIIFFLKVFHLNCSMKVNVLAHKNILTNIPSLRSSRTHLS